ncbi:hypothetical protein GCM10010256_12430 [Streptomyces coeruleorubidus]|nr:hypothetical protein GCM10010256_12430 [Streptomyces coeruleorubidus]
MVFTSMTDPSRLTNCVRDYGRRLGQRRRRRRAGPADSAGVSYESYNYPGRYVRHWEYLLNVQAVSTATDRADATFYAE